MNKRIDLTHIGGFPATQFTLDFMQQSYRSALSALANLCGDKVIVTGCVDDGTNISSGWLAINGELIPLAGGPKGDGGIVISETSEDRDFEDANTHPVYFSKVAQMGTPEDFNYSELVDIGTLKQTFVNLGNLADSLNDLAAAFNALNYGNLPGRPASYIAHQGVIAIGDLPSGDNLITVTIPNQGVNNYKVFGTFISQSFFGRNDNLTWAIHNRTATSFQITVQERESQVQAVDFEYIIVKSL